MGLFGDILSAFDVPRKSKGSAYASLIFLGLLGWHAFYLEKIPKGLLYIAAFIVLMLTWPALPFLHIQIDWLAYVSAGILVILYIYDFFTLWKQVDNWNKENAGNSLIETAGAIAGNVLSIPLENAIEEYNDIVNDYKDVLENFNEKKSEVESLLSRLQKARKDTLSVISRMREIVSKISIKDAEVVRDELSDHGDYSDDIFSQAIMGKEELSDSLEESIDIATLEMTNTFNAARELTEHFESGAGKFAAATAVTAINAIVQYGKQQEKIKELKKQREQILKQQNEVEIKIRQLEATEKRASEILKVIEAEIPGFNHIYNNFCTAVFPDGILYQKDRKSLTDEERKLLHNLCEAAKKIKIAALQEIETQESLVNKQLPSGNQHISNSIGNNNNSCNNCKYNSDFVRCSYYGIDIKSAKKLNCGMK